MSWTAFDTWIVLIGALCAVSCALPGCFLILRRMSMMGDAISHAVLPGLAIAFLISNSRSSWIMFVGAAVVGVLTAVFTQWINRLGRVEKGAAMGVVFTTLFAIGLILIRRASALDHVDIDPACVLHGAIELAPWDTIKVLGYEVPRTFIVLLLTCLLNLAVITIFFKEFRLSSFDPQLADTLGFPSPLLHYLLMILVAVTTVACFEAVGSVIVIAMLIVPGATALLITHRLSLVLIIAATFGILAAFLGHIGAIIIPPVLGFERSNSAGMMATASGLLFLIVWVAHPKHGLIRQFIVSRSTQNNPSTNRDTLIG